MSEATKRTIRTVLQGILTAAVLLPLAVTQAGVNVEWPWVAGTLAGLGVVARLLQTPAAESLLGLVGLALTDPQASGTDPLARRR